MAQASFAELEHEMKKRRTRRELFLENPSLPLFGPEGLILGSLWDLRH